MGIDYGFFEALTGPMKTTGAIQDNRDKQKMQQLQLLQQQRNMELQQLDKQKQQQAELNQYTTAALKDLYTKDHFARKKDIDDYRDWHGTSSGWEEIKNIISEAGSLDNARLNYNLDYHMQEYYANLTDNPVSRRANKNKTALELYHSFDLDKVKNSKLITSGARTRYVDFINGKSDNEIKSLSSLKRGVYVNRNLTEGHLLTETDLYFAMPLQENQLDASDYHEIVGSETNGKKLIKDSPLMSSDVIAPYKKVIIDDL